MGRTVRVLLAILLCLPASANSFRLGAQAERSFTVVAPAASGAPAPTVTIGPQPFTRTVTCTGSYTLTGTATDVTSVAWAASPSGESGACTGTTSWSCAVAVSPDASGEGVETITVTATGAGGTGDDTETIGFYVAGAHSCWLAQSADGDYNSTLVTTDPVATWVNLGSSALDVTQAVGSAQPTYLTGVVGGQPVVRYDGGDRLDAATASDWDFTVNGTDYTIGSVFINNGTNYAISSTRTSNVDGFVLGGSSATPRFEIDDGTLVVVGVASVSTMTSGLWHSQEATLDDDGGVGDDAFLYLDGVLHATGAATIGYPTAAGRFLSLGLGRLVGASQFSFTGDIFRVLIYQSALTSTQRGINQAVDEWALGGTLPVTP